MFSICIGGLNSFNVISMVMAFTLRNTVILHYTTIGKHIIISKSKKEIVVIQSFIKEFDYQASYTDELGTNKSVYGIVVKLNGDIKKYSFAIWDSQHEYQDNYARLRMNAIIARKKAFGY